MHTQTILSFFSADNRRLDDLFHRFQQLGWTDRAAACDVFEQFKAGLELHILWEEDVLFPVFEEKMALDGSGPTPMMRREHRDICQLLTSIQQTLAGLNADPDATELALAQLWRPHQEKEQLILYPTLDHMLTPKERLDVFAVMRHIERETAAGPCEAASA